MRRVCYDHELRKLVLRRTTSVDVGGETKGRCDHQPQEGFLVAKLSVGAPTSAGCIVNECMSIDVAKR
jgi:hypothetical protein